MREATSALIAKGNASLNAGNHTVVRSAPSSLTARVARLGNSLGFEARLAVAFRATLQLRRLFGDYASSNGNTWNMVNAGHEIRFWVFEKGPPEAAEGEVFDCVVVGGGLARLSTAWTFKRDSGAKRTCLILENHPMFGGESKRNDLMVDGRRIACATDRQYIGLAADFYWSVSNHDS
jgi:hypothetical protein